MLQADLPLPTHPLRAPGASSAACIALVRVPVAVRPLVPVHVAIGGEGLSTKLAREGSLSRVDQHVTVKGAKGGEHLATEAAVVDLSLPRGIVGIWTRLDLIVAPDVGGEVLLRGQVFLADWALVLLRQRPSAGVSGAASATSASSGLGAAGGWRRDDDGGLGRVVVAAVAARPVAQGRRGAMVANGRRRGGRWRLRELRRRGCGGGCGGCSSSGCRGCRPR